MVDRYYMEDIANKIYSKDEVIAVFKETLQGIKDLPSKEGCYYRGDSCIDREDAIEVVQERIDVLKTNRGTDE